MKCVICNEESLYIYGGNSLCLKHFNDRVAVGTSKKEDYHKLMQSHKGNTILIIEHNMDVIKLADYIIDIGPEGGKGGGEVVAKGTPEEIIKNKKSHTAPFLKKELL